MRHTQPRVVPSQSLDPMLILVHRLLRAGVKNRTGGTTTSWIGVRHSSTSSESNKGGNSHLDERANSAKDTLKKNAAILHENIYTLPNLLTMTRLISAPVIGYWLDGWIARRFQMQSIVGTIIDPMADKTLMTILTVTLAMQHLISVPVAGLILGRDLGLVLSSFYYRYISLPEPKTFARYWDFSIPSAEVHPTMISKVNTAIQMAYIGLSLVAPVLDFSGHVGLEYLGYTCALTTVWSGASYIYSKDAVKILYPKK
ncbi:hypothetical protein DFQ26_001048 [Actinomortierella ambigua]|nr:hypothetical protein DFQ26_001048 [Actinomortierella ambigua]